MLGDEACHLSAVPLPEPFGLLIATPGDLLEQLGVLPREVVSGWCPGRS